MDWAESDKHMIVDSAQGYKRGWYAQLFRPLEDQDSNLCPWQLP